MDLTSHFRLSGESADKKQCFKCQRILPIAGFYKHPRMADGHLNKCKSCTRADVRRNRMENLKYYRLYDANRYRANPRRREARDAYSLSVSGHEKQREAKKRWDHRNGHKRRAQNCLRRAVQNGQLEKPSTCQSCGEEVEDSRQLHAHHEDYSKPLVVEWLCSACHGVRHTKYQGFVTGLSHQDLADIQQLIDLGTEEAIADIWTRYNLNLEEALRMVGEGR